MQNTSGYAVKSVRSQADLAAWRDVETLAAGSFMLDHGQALLGNGDVQIDWRAPASVAGHFAVLDQSLVDAAGYAVHNDHLGTPQRITDSAQVVVWTADYLPFGEAQVGVGLIEENNRFQGQYFDEESELHYNYYRDYDPTIGRYLQADPVSILKDYSDPQIQVARQMGIIAPEGLYGSLNHLYGYADQNPIGAIDPYGLSPKDKLFGLPKKFWQWYHRNEKRPGDPDLDKESAEQLHQEWKDKGKPGPDSKRNQNNYSVPDPISLGAYVACLQGFMSCNACTLLGFPSPRCDDDFSC